MDCQKFGQLILMSSSELTVDDKKFLKIHSEQCEECRAIVESQKLLETSIVEISISDEKFKQIKTNIISHFNSDSVTDKKASLWSFLSRKSDQFVFAAISLIIFFIFIYGFKQFYPAAKKQLPRVAFARILSMKGKAQVRRHKDEVLEAVALQTKLFPGDTVICLNQAKVEIYFDSLSSKTKLYGFSCFTIGDNKTIGYQKIGTVVFKVKPQNNTVYVTSSHGITTVLGTQFAQEVATDSLVIKVKKGTVSFKNEKGEIAIIKKLQRLKWDAKNRLIQTMVENKSNYDKGELPFQSQNTLEEVSESSKQSERIAEDEYKTLDKKNEIENSIIIEDNKPSDAFRNSDKKLESEEVNRIGNLDKAF